jgi:hypothetical protein
MSLHASQLWIVVLSELEAGYVKKFLLLFKYTNNFYLLPEGTVTIAEKKYLILKDKAKFLLVRWMIK